MALISVKFDVEIPDEIASKCTNEQIEEWLCYSLNETGTLHFSPIQDSELEAKFNTVRWTWIKEPNGQDRFTR